MSNETDNRQFAITWRYIGQREITETHTGFDAAWNRRREILGSARISGCSLPTIVE